MVPSTGAVEFSLHKDLPFSGSRGCVTPLQIKNLQDQVGPLEDLDLDSDLPHIIDGYDEISSESQDKIKFALQNGHVPDEDWKGVSQSHCDLHKFLLLTRRGTSSLRRIGQVKKASTNVHQRRERILKRKTEAPMRAMSKRHLSLKSRRVGRKEPRSSLIRTSMRQPHHPLPKRPEAANVRSMRMKRIPKSNLRRRKLQVASAKLSRATQRMR